MSTSYAGNTENEEPACKLRLVFVKNQFLILSSLQFLFFSLLIQNVSEILTF